LKIIDFGLAVLHPFASEGNNLSLSHPLSAGDVSFDSYKCNPYPNEFFPPGKATYQSPEMYAHKPWDAFAADVFAIGVIAYTLLTGHPPFHAPVSATKQQSIAPSELFSSENNNSVSSDTASDVHHSDVGDPWYTAISTGAWLNDDIKSQPSASIYTHLSANALSFIDRAIKPENSRASIDELLNHPFLNSS
jgi:serine/threonine protein kinase